jgi:hypothetical protein
LNNKFEEFNREVQAFKYNLEVYIARKIQELSPSSKINGKSISEDHIRAASNLKLTVTSITSFCSQFSQIIFKHFKEPPMVFLADSKQYMRTYLKAFLQSKKAVKASAKKEIFQILDQSMSNKGLHENFYDFLFTASLEFANMEIIKSF